MTREFQTLMHLMCACSRGEKPDAPADAIDWHRVAQLAEEQMAAALLGCALKCAPEIACPEDIRRRMIQCMRHTAAVNIARQPQIVKLLERMGQAGIPAVLLKGFDAAACYHVPECRGSGDTDILIAPSDEKKACAFLRREGFQVEPRWAHGHHAVAVHPQLGIVEVHIRLYDEIIEDMWFGRRGEAAFVQEERRLVRTADGTYAALGVTDTLIFLALHTVKHFVECGMSIRMMLDVALWIERYRDVLDMERFWTLMEEMRYAALVRSILHALIRYGGFPADAFPGLGAADEGQIGMILTDLEQGGWMGMLDKRDRDAGWHAYNRAQMLRCMKPWQYRCRMLKWQADMLMGQLFPARTQLQAKYPALAEHPWLLPAVWMHRLAFRGTRALRRGALTACILRGEDSLAPAGQARADMFRKLGMM